MIDRKEEHGKLLWMIQERLLYHMLVFVGGGDILSLILNILHLQISFSLSPYPLTLYYESDSLGAFECVCACLWCLVLHLTLQYAS